LSNPEVVKASSVRLIAMSTEGNEEILEAADRVLHIRAPEMLGPTLEVVPLQLLVCNIAVRRRCDADQPRNLAKSVTVE
jgi:glutamine---fructose-6-phosphate transaminase (isomerizing)